MSDSRLYVVGTDVLNKKATTRRPHADDTTPLGLDLDRAACYAVEMRQGVRNGYASRLVTPEAWTALLAEYTGNVAKQVTNARLALSHERALLHDAGVEACMLAAAAMEAARAFGIGPGDDEGQAA